MKRTIVGFCLLASFIASAHAQTQSQVKRSAEKAISLMLASDKVWEKNQSCNSCHHQAAPMEAFRRAMDRGLKVDEGAIRATALRTFKYLDGPNALDQSIQGSHYIDPGLSESLEMVAADTAGVKPSLAIAARALFIANRQTKEGYWISTDARPPQTGSVVDSTALTIRALQLYLAPYQPIQTKSRIERAKKWLLRAHPTDTSDAAYRLLGLKWSGASPRQLRSATLDLLKLQRPDGGWAQLPARQSDAYATSLTIAALKSLPRTENARSRGIAFLLKTQAADGSWKVPTRLHQPAPLSPSYFETGFPYGRDQVISCTGTALATAVLLDTVLAKKTTTLYKGNPKSYAPWVRTVMFGSVKDVKRLLAKGFDVNSKTNLGTTALMLAVPDVKKMELLIGRGAKVDALAKSGFTPLMVAANSGDGLGAVKLLLNRGADPRQSTKAVLGATVFTLAAFSGDTEKLKLLNPSAKDLQTEMVLGEIIPVSSIVLATFNRDEKMVREMIKRGAPFDEPDPNGLTLLDDAIFDSDLPLTKMLLAFGADPNHVDKLGMTPLLWAALIDHGSTEILQALLAKGADLNAKSKEGLTALDLAKKHHYPHMQRVLEQATIGTSASRPEAHTLKSQA